MFSYQNLTHNLAWTQLHGPRTGFLEFFRILEWLVQSATKLIAATSLVRAGSSPVNLFISQKNLQASFCSFETIFKLELNKDGVKATMVML